MAQKFWVGGSGNWDDTNHWSASSGGSGGTGVPGSADNANFDANSFSGVGQTVSVRNDQTNQCNNLDTTGVTNNPTFQWFSNIAAHNPNLTVLGNLTITSSVTITQSVGAVTTSTLKLNATSGTQNVTVGADCSVLEFITNGATISLQADLKIGALDHTGIWTTNNHTWTITSFTMESGTLNLGASTVNIIFSSLFSVKFSFGTNITCVVNAGTSLLYFKNGGNLSVNTNNTGSLVFNNVQFGIATLVDGGFIITGNGSITVNNLTLDPGGEYKITTNGTIKITGLFTATGTLFQPITLISSSSGVQAHIQSVNQAVVVYYVAVKDINASGQIPFLDYNGTNNGNNTNWNFVQTTVISSITPTGVSGQVSITTNIPSTGFVYSPITSVPFIGDVNTTNSLILPSVITTVISGLIPGITYYFESYTIDGSGNIIYSPVFIFTVNALIVKKRFYYKVYNTSLQYVTTWSTDVISDPSFRMVVNGGAGELLIKLGRKYTSFGEGTDVVLNYRVELWVMDCDAPNGTKIFTGYIADYAPTIDDENQYVQITVLGYATRLSAHVLKDGATGDTTINYVGFDPAAILKDAIDKYHGDGGTDVFYSNTSIQNTNTAINYSFINNTIQDVLDKVVQFTSYNWYWFVDANGIIFLQPANIASPDHRVTIGKDLSYVSSNRRLEGVVNAVNVVGGGTPTPLYNYYERTSSIAQYGKWEVSIQDYRITDNTTADYIVKRKLDQFQTPEYRTTLKIIDNNGENQLQGANIEVFYPGQTLQIVNLGNAPILIIQSVYYYPDHLEIEASTRLPEIAIDLNNVSTALTTLGQTQLPDAPTVRSV